MSALLLLPFRNPERFKRRSAYACPGCNKVCSGGAYGPPSIIPYDDHPGAIERHSDHWWCRSCSIDLWHEFRSREKQLPARRRRLMLYRRGLLPFQQVRAGLSHSQWVEAMELIHRRAAPLES